MMMMMMMKLLLLASVASASTALLCGNTTLPLTPGRPNVLLIGDSISMTPPYTPGGYGGVLAALLTTSGIAVQHAGGAFSGGQCGDTRRGIICTNLTGESWLSVSGFDLVHFNFGLHDLADYGPTLPTLPIPQYQANLLAIYNRIASNSKAVMWTSTTPVPNVPTSYNRSYAAAVEYNAAALAVLTGASKNLLVNDLWSAFIAHCGVEYTSCDLQLPANVHLTPKGIDFAAQSAAKDILAALGK